MRPPKHVQNALQLAYMQRLTCLSSAGLVLSKAIRCDLLNMSWPGSMLPWPHVHTWTPYTAMQTTPADAYIPLLVPFRTRMLRQSPLHSSNVRWVKGHAMQAVDLGTNDMGMGLR